jgi:hypothetical protein
MKNFKPKYRFVKHNDEENEFDTSQVIIAVDTDNLSDLLEEFEAFLHACGFQPPGKLDFIVEENASVSETGPIHYTRTISEDFE